MAELKSANGGISPRLLDLLVDGWRAWQGRAYGPDDGGWLEALLATGDVELEGTYRAHHTVVDAEARRRGRRRPWAVVRLKQLAREARYRREHGIAE